MILNKDTTFRCQRATHAIVYTEVLDEVESVVNETLPSYFTASITLGSFYLLLLMDYSSYCQTLLKNKSPCI